MDELIVLVVRWIIGRMNNRSNPPGASGRGTPALPPAWSGGGPAPTPPVPAVRRPQGRPQPPPLRQVQLARGVKAAPPVVATQPVATAVKKLTATAVAHTGLTSLRSSITTASIRKQWIMYELLQPPVALRDPG